MARRFVNTRPGKTIDYKQWTSVPGLIDSQSADTTFIGGGLSFAVPATILRVRGYVAAMFDETRQINDQMVVNFALGLVSTDAFVVGATAVPDPVAEPEYPWLWWMEMRLDAFVVAANQASTPWGPAGQRYEVDTKAMRRVKPGETLVMVGSLSNATGAPATLLDIGQQRVLIGT